MILAPLRRRQVHGCLWQLRERQWKKYTEIKAFVLQSEVGEIVTDWFNWILIRTHSSGWKEAEALRRIMAGVAARLACSHFVEDDKNRSWSAFRNSLSIFQRDDLFGQCDLSWSFLVSCRICGLNLRAKPRYHGNFEVNGASGGKIAHMSGIPNISLDFQCTYHHAPTSHKWECKACHWGNQVRDF